VVITQIAHAQVADARSEVQFDGFLVAVKRRRLQSALPIKLHGEVLANLDRPVLNVTRTADCGDLSCYSIFGILLRFVWADDGLASFAAGPAGNVISPPPAPMISIGALAGTQPRALADRVFFPGFGIAAAAALERSPLQLSSPLVRSLY
jgi:hypothetical protein